MHPTNPISPKRIKNATKRAKSAMASERAKPVRWQVVITVKDCFESDGLRDTEEDGEPNTRTGQTELPMPAPTEFRPLGNEACTSGLAAGVPRVTHWVENPRGCSENRWHRESWRPQLNREGAHPSPTELRPKPRAGGMHVWTSGHPAKRPREHWDSERRF